jgi:hypothetical protein
MAAVTLDMVVSRPLPSILVFETPCPHKYQYRPGERVNDTLTIHGVY